MSRRILPKATAACTKMILSIEDESSLLLCLPLHMFQRIYVEFMYAASRSDTHISIEDHLHVESLLLTYVEHNVGSEYGAYFATYFCECRILYSAEMKNEENISEFHLVARTNLVLKWFELLERKGWENVGWPLVHLQDKFYEYLRDHIRSQYPPCFELMERIVNVAPSSVVAKLLLSAGSTFVNQTSS